MASRGRWIITLLVVAGSTLALRGPAAGQGRPGSNKAIAPSATSGLLADRQSAALDIGSVVTDALGDGDDVWPERRFVDAWALIGRAGTTVTVDLLSDEFDAVLYLAGGPDLLWDDDSAGGCDARIAITFPTSGTYVLYASSYRANESGAYTIRVSNRPATPVDATCASADAAPSEPATPPNETCTTVRFMEWLSLAAEEGGGADHEQLSARERTACDLGLETDSGEMWPTGRLARQLSTWYYPNGRTARQLGTWYYPNGQLAQQLGTWYYPNGQVARQLGNWSLPNATRTSPAGIIEYALARLTPERGEGLLDSYASGSGDFQDLVLIVMASEASR